MAVKVREGIDYRILDDDYRANFRNSYKPYKTLPNGTKLYKCIYCGQVVALGEEYNGQAPMEVDHIIPKTRMGAGILWNPNKSWNLGPSCKSCNISKSNYIDMKVIRGFNNKLKQKYLFGALQNNSELDTEESTTSKALTVSLTALIALITVLSPLVIVLTWILQGLWSLIRRIFSLIVKATRKEARRVIKHGKRALSKIIAKVLSAIVFVYVILVIANYFKTGTISYIIPLQNFGKMTKIVLDFIGVNFKFLNIK